MIDFTQRIRFRKFWAIGLLTIFCLALSISQSFGDNKYGLGDIPLKPEEYKQYLRLVPNKVKDALPEDYDARDEGLVTIPKNQGNCGSCWAFASVGAFESHLLKEASFGITNLSEQQPVSCDITMWGCCGGNMTAIQYWETKGPFYESCCSYGESGTPCPPEPPYYTVPCSDCDTCIGLPYRTENFHTVYMADPAEVKASVYDDGPSYFRFDVYSDFLDYWYGVTTWPDDVYRQNYGSFEGGHAVLIIGWIDSLNAYICKNSWGATSSPFGDGTFLMAISGHDNDLDFGMANFNLRGELCGIVYDGDGGGPLTAGISYVVTCDTEVPSGETLTIQPGAHISFESGYKIIANGTINANGEQSNPIHLISVGDGHGMKLGSKLRLQNGGCFNP